MPHPASSSVGYMSVAHWLQSKGESEGRAFMDALNQNIAAYLHSGSAPCAKVGQGEYLAGIGLDAAGAAQKLKGAPIALILPEGGAAWDIDTAVLLKGARNPDGGRRFLDFALSRDAAEINGKYRAVLPRLDVEPDPAGFPPVPPGSLATIDFAKFGAERERILAEWSRRYESKAAPK
jgi:iron(III) transport system substrate-binding protein